MEIVDLLARLGPDGEGYFGRAAFPAIRAAILKAQQRARAKRDAAWRKAYRDVHGRGIAHRRDCVCAACERLRMLLQRD